MNIKSIDSLLLQFFILTILLFGCEVVGDLKTGGSDSNSSDANVVSTYIRSSFYETGQISEESLLHNNDIIYLAGRPYADGELFFEFPVNHGELTQANHLNSFEGRNGVIEFTGEGSSMNAGQGLLNKANAGASSFTFATWVYIDSWEENSFIFQKTSDWKNRIDIQLGPKQVNGTQKNRLYLHIADGQNQYAAADNSGITEGEWHHIAFTYQGNAGSYKQVKFYVDGQQQDLWYSSGNGTMPTSGPFVRSDFELGANFDGKLDETSINLFSLGANAINDLKNNPLVVDSWNETKTTAYWKYDDVAKPGKDSRTWLGVLDDLKQSLQGYPDIKLRLGVAGGPWKTTFQTTEARENFAQNVNNIVSEHNLDGVDFDFEWALNDTEWTNYSNAIVAMDAALPSASMFTVSLHAVYYNISQDAIDATDYISIQSYGPSPVRFSYSEFVDNVNTVLNYGIPPEKLVMGLPFYAVTSDGSKIARSYYNIVDAHPNLDPSLDEVSLDVIINGQTQSKQFTFNGQETIKQKVNHVLSEDLAGLMYWDIATDVDYGNDLSLLRALNTALTDSSN